MYVHNENKFLLPLVRHSSNGHDFRSEKMNMQHTRT